MKKFILILLLLPFLNNCTQYSSALGPGLTMMRSGSVMQASASYATSLSMNKFKEDYINELNVEKICPTIHSSELNAIFFETIDHLDCYFDPMSIYR